MGPLARNMLLCLCCSTADLCSHMCNSQEKFSRLLISYRSTTGDTTGTSAACA